MLKFYIFNFGYIFLVDWWWKEGRLVMEMVWEIFNDVVVCVDFEVVWCVEVLLVMVG